MFKRLSLFLLLLCAAMTSAMALTPVKSSAISVDQFNYVAWYHLSISDGYVIAAPTNGGQITMDATVTTYTDNDDSQLWAFVGDETNGYTIYNKALGLDYVLTATTGSTDATLSMTLASEVDATTTTSVWMLSLSSYPGGQGNAGWYMYEADNTSYYVNFTSTNSYLDLATTAGTATTLDITPVSETYYEATKIAVTHSGGTYDRTDGGSTTGSVDRWYSNTTPVLTISTTKNDINASGSDDNLVVNPGSAGSDNIVLSVPAGYCITGYTFGFSLQTEDTSITLTANSSSYTVSSEVQTVTVEDISAASATIGISGDNNGVIFTDFVVTIAEADNSIAVTHSNGSYERTDGGSGNWVDRWYSNTCPQLTISTSANDIYKQGRDDCLSVACGSAYNDNLVLSVPDGYIITGYTFGFKLYSSGTITLTSNGESYSVTSEVQTVTVADNETSSVTININGTNNEVVFSSFTVTVAPEPEEESLPVGYELFAHRDTISVGSGSGSLNNSSGWSYRWTDSSSILTVSAVNASGNNAANMNYSGTNLNMYTGSAAAKTSVYTIAVPSSAATYQKVIGYVKVTLTRNSSTTDPDLQMIAYTSESDSVYIITTDGTTIEMNGINSSSCTITLVGPNTGCVASDFDVEIFSINRIPALTTTRTGRIIALADLRPSSRDIGQTTLELKTEERHSDDGGVTWSAVRTITDINTMTDSGRILCGFGDPALIADRTSDKVLLILCSGDVSFPNGTRDDHAAIARFYSEDNGDTWSNPVDISDQIYDQLTDMKSMFVTSGRIVQSRYTRVGEYYRIYAAVICLDTDGYYVNYVIYSDDFGENWSILGGTDAQALKGSSYTLVNEAKVDELPDGSIVISSRMTGGRRFNIYRDGAWGTEATSTPSNSGVCTLSSNGTNGAFMVVPVTEVATGEQVHLALQSLPNSTSREDVIIAYKALRSIDDYTDASALAANWDGYFQVSDVVSAYSAMTLTAQDSIGFAYEEDRYNLELMISYQNFSIDEITDGAFTIVHTQNVTLDESNTLDADGNLDNYTDTRAENTNTNIVMMRQMQSGIWNTFCSPAAMSADEIEENFGSGANIQEFTNVTEETSEDNETTSLYINFAVVDSIEAGKPYLVKLGSDMTDGITSIVLRDTKVTNTTTSVTDTGGHGITFNGNFDAVVLSTDDNLFFNASGFLVKPSTSSSRLKGMRAYFTVSSAAQSQLAGVILVDDEGELTVVHGIEGLTDSPARTDGTIYDLQGRRVTYPVKGGIYIQNGKKFIK